MALSLRLLRYFVAAAESGSTTAAAVQLNVSQPSISVAIRELQALSRDVARFMNDYDMLLTPVLGMPPVAHGELMAKGFEARLQETQAEVRRVFNTLLERQS